MQSDYKNADSLKLGINYITGSMLCLISCFCYALYTLLIEILCKSQGGEEKFDMNMFLGFVGVYNTLFSLLVLISAHYFGWSTF